MIFFFAEIKKHLKIHMESQGTPNNQNNAEKQEQSWIHTSWIQNSLQTYYINENSVVSA